MCGRQRISENNTVQPFWTKWIPEISKCCHSTLEFASTHTIPTLGNKQPDIIVKEKDQSPKAVCHIVAVGEVKGDKKVNKEYRANALGSNEMGQVEQYLMRLLAKQTYRHKAFGFLTNNRDFLVVKATRERDDIHFLWFVWESVESNFRKALSWFVQLSPESHGFIHPIKRSIVTLDDYLGCGSYSDVYKGTLANNRREVVVKLFKRSGDAEKEKRNLDTLASAKVKNIPKWKQLLTDENALILTPYARKLEIFELDQQNIRDMVDTLYNAHQAKIVHGDVRAPNLFKTNEGGVLVNDWGTAVKVGSEVEPFAGAVVEGSNDLLSSLADGVKVIAKTNNDLHALARTIFCISYSIPETKLPLKQPYEYKVIQRFWSSVNDAWLRIFSLAENASDEQSYADFANALSSQLPLKELK